MDPAQLASPLASSLVLPLAQESFFFTIANVGAAFVGFSMLAELLRPDEGDLARFYSTTNVAEISLTVVVVALLPSLIHSFSLPPGTTWRVASFIFIFAWIGAAYLGIRRYRDPIVRDASPSFLWIGPMTTPFGLGALVWNVASPDQLAPARYALGLVVLLIFAGLNFLAAAFHRPPSSKPQD